MAPKFFNHLEARWGPHTVDLFASSDNAQCKKFYSLHWCRGTAGVNAFGFPWSGENCWINAPYRAIDRVWRALKEQQHSQPCCFLCGSHPSGGTLSSPTDDICLSLWWIGCGFLEVIRTSSLEGRHRVARSCPPTCLLWPSGLISRKEKGVVI